PVRSVLPPPPPPPKQPRLSPSSCPSCTHLCALDDPAAVRFGHLLDRQLHHLRDAVRVQLRDPVEQAIHEARRYLHQDQDLVLTGDPTLPTVDRDQAGNEVPAGDQTLLDERSYE